MLNMYTATIKTMFANFYDQNFQLTVVGRTGLCGVHVQQHVTEEPSHEHARALTRLRRTAGRIV